MEGPFAISLSTQNNYREKSEKEAPTPRREDSLVEGSLLAGSDSVRMKREREKKVRGAPAGWGVEGAGADRAGGAQRRGGGVRADGVRGGSTRDLGRDRRGRGVNNECLWLRDREGEGVSRGLEEGGIGRRISHEKKGADAAA